MKKSILFVAGLVLAVFIASGFALVHAADEPASSSAVVSPIVEPTPTVTQVNSAMQELATAVGHPITTKKEAHEICDMDEYLTICAEIGKKHKLYSSERVKDVDSILENIKGTIIAQLKECKTQECLVKVADLLSKKLVVKNPKLAEKVNLSAKKIEEHKAVIQAAKDNGVTPEQCKSMMVASSSLDRLQGCAKFVKDARTQAQIPEAKRAENAQSLKMVEFRTALKDGTITCGDNTVEGCTKYCFTRPDQKLTDASSPTPVPSICKDIAAKYFGPDAVHKLENLQRPPPKPVEHPKTSDSPGFIFRLLDKFFLP